MMRLLALIGTLVPFVLSAMLVLVYWGEEVSGDAGANGSRASDLLAEAASALAAGRAFECSEEALNAYLCELLEVREADGFEIFAEFQSLRIRLLEAGMEVLLERDFLGLHSTVVARIEVSAVDGGHQLRVVGGRFGRLPAPPGAMHLLRGGLANLGKALEPEKGVLSDAGDVSLTPGRLRLEPRPTP